MTDTHTLEQRHLNMSHIHGSDTSIEVELRRELFAMGFRFRKNVRTLTGKPDIVLPKYKTVIFIHGCFWHRHEGCRLATTPKTRVGFWQDKFSRNVQRDKAQTEKLLEMGWNVIVVWECELKRDIKGVVSELEIILKQIIPSSTKLLTVPGMGCFVNRNQK